MVDRSVATADEILCAAVDELVRLRPAALLHFNHSANGRWSGVFKAWRAMLIVCLRRQSSEMVASSLKLAVGKALRELCASEFDTIVDESPIAGIGEVTLFRNGVGLALVIPEKTLFTRSGNPNAFPLPLVAAEYETTTPAIFTTNQTETTIPIRAVRTGSASNVVQETGVVAPTFTLATPIVTAGWVWSVTRSMCAGGRSAIKDDDIKRIAEVQPLGGIGPTRDAIVAGILRETGIDHYGLFDIPDTAGLRLFAADKSWGTSGQLTSHAIQTLKSNEWLGFGGYIDSGLVENKFIRIEATIQLQDSRYLSFTEEISSKIRAALRSYFDDRPNWWTWKLSTIRGTISRADRRILACTSVTVRDRNDNVVNEPGAVNPGSTLLHYYLLADGFLPTFTGPL